MGAVDLVPGVSGGSIALITNIYEELLDSIKSINLEALSLLRSFQIKAFWRHINGGFLVTLLAGILTSIFTFSKAITYVMEHYPIPLWSFFCGLILIGGLVILKDIQRWTVLAVIGIPLGVVLAYFITELPPMSTPDALWFTFLSGAIAICAMIMPGISGSFILLIMGQYEYILNAVNERNFPVIIVFAAGCAIGIVSTSWFISWLLKKFHAVTLSLLCGFMLGSINKIWPWKKVLSYRVSISGEQKPLITENIWPHHYLAETGDESQFLVAILAFLVGVILVVGVERVAAYSKASE